MSKANISISNGDNLLGVEMNDKDKNCPELTQETANAIDNSILHDLFISTQMNNLDLCAKCALE